MDKHFTVQSGTKPLSTRAITYVRNTINDGYFGYTKLATNVLSNPSLPGNNSNQSRHERAKESSTIGI